MVWVASGLRQLDPATEFGVIGGVLLPGSPYRVDGSWALAPPGVTSFARYPRHPVELPMPGAERLLLPGIDGSRYGFRGSALVSSEPDAWRSLHAAAAGRGIEGVLVDAVRAAGRQLPPGAETGVATPAFARALNHRLRDELARRGLELGRFTLDGLDFLEAEPGRTYPPTDARLLMVGLDGADWAILDELIAAGRMPNLARLIERGVRAKLLSISPTLSPVVWTTVATGVEPGRHGVLDFLVSSADGTDRQPVTSAQRRAATFWEILSRVGVPVGVVGWWASWPADPVEGYLVTDRVAYQLFGFSADPGDPHGKTWPPELYEAEVRPRVVEPRSVPWDDVRRYLSGERVEREQFDEPEQKMLDEFRTVLASGRTYLDVALALRARNEPRVEVVYFEGTDTVGHLFMPFRLPVRSGIDPGSSRSFRSIVDRYYETADGYLGRLLEGRGEEWTVMVLSDHGFASDETRPRLTDSRIGHGGAADWHSRFGVLVLSGAGVRPGVTLEEASVYDIAPTVLALFGQPVPGSWPGQVLGAALEPGFLERHPVRYAREDPPRSPDGNGREDLPDAGAADVVAKLESLGYIATGPEQREAGGPALTAANNTGVALLARGSFAEAEEVFRGALDEAPGNPSLLTNLGSALRLQGRPDEARPYLERAYEHASARREAGNLLAEIALEQGRLDEAERYLREVLRDEPDAARVRTTLGRLLERRGRTRDAETEYRRAAAVDRNAAQPRNLLGNIARDRGDEAEAERWYTEAIEANPYELGAYNNLALVYQDRGEMERAIELYARALTKAPNNPVVLNNLASLYYAEGDLDEAAALWRRATRTNPAYPSPYNNLAGLEIRAERFDEAETLLLHALELDPEYGDARLNLAIVYRARGEPERSRRELERAAEDPRSRPRALSQLAFMEFEAGRWADAVELLERMRASGEPDVAALNLLGECYRRLERREQAEEAWRASLALRPGQPELRARLAELQAVR